MSAGVALLGRGLAEHWKGATAAVVAVFAMLLMGLGIYQSLDLSIYEQMPETIRALLGTPEGASPEIFAYTEMLGTMGGLALAGVAVAIGAQAIAGEEGERRLSFLLAHPVSRTATVVSQALVLVLVIAVATLTLWGTSLLAGMLYSVSLGEAHIGALSVALGANALFHGALAFAVGAVTGDKSLAGAIGGAVLAFGWLGAGLLPLSPDTADYAKFIPWHWYVDQQALVNGLDGGHLGLLLGLSAAQLLVGILWLPRRDLRTIPRATLAERMGSLPVLSRFSRARRASSLFGLTFGRSLTLLVVVSAVMSLFMGVSMGPIYAALEPSLATMMESLPMDMMVLAGAGDMSTPTGFYWGETFGMMAPAAVIVVVAVAAAGLAAEERSGRLGPVLAAPVPRARLVVATTLTMLAYAAIVAYGTGLGVWVGSAIADMGLEASHVLGTATHLFALGVFIGGLTLLVAAATGNPQAATWTAVGVGVVGHFGAAMVRLSPDTADYARLSPFHYYSSSEPLAHGADWGHVLILVGAGAACIVAALWWFRQRDLRV